MRDAIGSAIGVAVLTVMLLTGITVPSHAPERQAASPTTAPKPAPNSHRPQPSQVARPAVPAAPAAPKADRPARPRTAAIVTDDRMKARTRTVARVPAEPRVVSKSKIVQPIP